AVFFPRRPASHQQIQLLAFYDDAGLFLHLLRSQMNQQIGDGKDRLVLLFTDADFHSAAILHSHYPMYRQRQRYPLIFLDTAVIVCIEVGQLVTLIERILFHVYPRGIYMSTKDIHPLLQRTAADIEQRYALIHAHSIYL